MTDTITPRLQAVLDRVVDGRKVFGSAFALQAPGLSWSGAAGDITPTTPFFIASTTKLFTTAVILQLRQEGRLALGDALTRHLPAERLQGLHLWKGVDRTPALTLHHLLAHTSGLSDYFQDRFPGGRRLEEELRSGRDRRWDLQEVLRRTRAAGARFPPGQPGKAHYSDTNFQLLGAVIERLTGATYAENCRQRIIEPLGLSGTWLYEDPDDRRPVDIRYHERPLSIPLAMSSFGPDGGMVSTAVDLLRFLEAFFNGRLFPAGYLPGLQVWNRIFFPMQSGVGIHRFRLPWYFDPARSVPACIGHSGLSGALAFHSPAKGLFIAGTVNQLAHPDISFRTMVRLILAATRRR